MKDDESRARMTFVVRLVRDHEGDVTGVLECVRTGEKVRLAGLDAVTPALAAMLDQDLRERSGSEFPGSVASCEPHP